MGFVAWLVAAAAGLLLFSAYKGTNPVEAARALLRGEPAPGTAFPIGTEIGRRLRPAAGGAGVGGLLMPVAGPIVSGFRTASRPDHEGIDIAASTGTPVKAAGAGDVAVAGWRGGYGMAVYLRHGGGVETRYAHLSAIDVDPGQPVTQGQTVGRVGSTGDSSGPHLHFEVRVNGSPIDPQGAIGGVFV